jgi:predicted SAM-dependent methyltransferase
MLSYGLKRLYYVIFAVPMRINGFLYRHVRCPKQGLKVQLGPGQKNYIGGWLNVDANWISAKIDLWADLRIRRLPFKDSSVDVFYSHHVIEHLPDSSLLTHFQDMYRCLRSGGGFRVGGPNLGNACRKYVMGDTEWFSSFPDNRSSVGGRFVNFIFCAGEHLTALDESYLTELATKAGFKDIAVCKPGRDTRLGDLGVGQNVLANEHESDYDFPHTIILEARKP